MVHKHRGVLTSKGALRPHPVERKHGDKKVQRLHNESLETPSDIRRHHQGRKDIQTKLPIPKGVKPIIGRAKNKVTAVVDDDNYINIDLGKCEQKGIRLKFTRTEGRTKRTVALAIDK